MPRVSVIIPNYNHAPYLPRRIESVLGQTFADFELIILDDASPDNSREVIERYTADPRVRTVFNEANSGNTFRQWDKGLALATGDFVWIAESDDAAVPEFLDRMVAALEANPTSTLAVCNTHLIDQDGQTIGGFFDDWGPGGTSDYDVSAFDHDFAMSGTDYLARFMTPWNTIPNASAVLFRRKSLIDIAKPPESMRLCGDWLIYARLLAVGGIVRVAAPMNFFRQHRVNVRSRYRGFAFIKESMTVQREMANSIGMPVDAILSRIGDDYAHILISDISADRRLLPLAAWPVALRRGASFGRRVAARVMINLARQRLGGMRRLLRG